MCAAEVRGRIRWVERGRKFGQQAGEASVRTRSKERSEPDRVEREGRVSGSGVKKRVEGRTSEEDQQKTRGEGDGEERTCKEIDTGHFRPWDNPLPTAQHCGI